MSDRDKMLPEELTYRDELSYELPDSEVSGLKNNYYGDEENFEGSLLERMTSKIKKIKIGKIGQGKIKRLLILSLVVGLVYFGFGVLSSRRATNLKREIEAYNNNVSQAVESAPVSTYVAPVIDLELERKASNLEDKFLSELTKISNAVNEYKLQAAQLNQTASGTKEEVQEISERLDLLAEAMKQLVVELDALKPKKVAPKKPPIKKELYVIKAIVSGRVWLESASGKSVSLRVGDSLPGYGTVKLIAPRTGVVATSDGSTIQYGENDF